MKRFLNMVRIFFIALVPLALLAGCGGAEDRQAEHLKRAQEYYAQGNFPKARVEVRNVLQINATHAQARYLHALLHEEKGDWQGMFKSLNIAVTSDPDLVPARIKLGQMFLGNQMYDEVLEQVDAVLELDPSNADAHVLRASVLLYQGEKDEAVSEADRALATEPGHIGAIAVLVSVYRTDNPGRALEIIDEGIQIKGDDSTLLLLKVRLLEQQGRVEEAAGVYQSLIAEDPDNLMYSYSLVGIYQRNGRIDDAESIISDLVVAKPESIDLKLWLVQFIADNRSPELATQKLQQFLAEHPDDAELKLSLALYYRGLGQSPRAGKLYRQVLEMDPKGDYALEARNGLVEIAIEQGEMERASELLEEILAIDAQNSSALVTRARLALIDADYDRAVADLRTVLRNEPGSVNTLLLLAQAHEMRGSIGLARDSYAQVLEIEPDNADANFSIARLYLVEGEPDAARQQLLSILKHQPANAKAIDMLVSMLIEQGQWDQALQKIKDLQLQNNAHANYLRGRILFAQGDYEGASAAFKGTLEEIPGQLDAIVYLLRSYSQQGKHADAVAFIEAEIKRNPAEPGNYELAGDYYLQLKDRARAEAAYRQALAMAPDSPTVYQRLVSFYLAANDRQAALDLVRQGIERNPGEVRLHILQAGLYESSGSFEAARDVYEDLLKQRPDLEIAANNLAILLVDRFPSEANLRRAAKLSALLQRSRDPAFLDTVGWVKYRLGAYDEAVSILEMVRQLGGSGPEYSYHLGMAYYRNKQLELAREELELALAESDNDYFGKAEAKSVLLTL